ncbi:MAG: L-serine ammonia-lyase, iron-sulfur-dependent, subunit alpha [Firmicutes bacterium]|nr:L-serine ammonia-lyase, iron-sulfur-dependent, subunit alpha [Bacillota bacterium]
MKSIREIYKIGKGPSSSHTMGPEHAANWFRARYPQADRFRIVLYGSLSKTGVGHGTDRVLREVLAPLPTEIEFSSLMPENSHPNTLDLFAYQGNTLLGSARVESIGGGDIRIHGEPVGESPEVYVENSFAEISAYCRAAGIGTLSEYVERHEGTQIWEYLAEVWRVMQQAIADGLAASGVLPGGLNVQRKARFLFAQPGNSIPTQQQFQRVAAYAYAVAEQNAGGGTIVTAPTCGACGVVPAVLKFAQESGGFSDEQIVRALGAAGIIGALTKRNASISGAECGCQAEIGTACSMAAAALAELYGQQLNQVEYAAEVAMEHNLGLTCDPVRGLVQIPCIERNAVAAMRAISACNLSYFLTGSRTISYDMVCRAMYETGVHINLRYRETGEGGLAMIYGEPKRPAPEA